jgi:DNA polymerase III delta subunit
MINLSYIVGDRFLCILEKQKIIEKLNKKNEWQIKEIESGEKDGKVKIERLCSEINQKDILSLKKDIFILDNIIPDPIESFYDFINNLSRNKHVIIISENYIVPQSNFHKKIKDKIIEKPSIFDGKGFIDKKKIEIGKKIIKEDFNWTGSEECLSFIMERVDYDYAAIYNEIEKIRTIYDKDPEKISEIKEIVSNSSTRDIDYLIDYIKEKNLNQSLILINEIFSKKENEINTFVSSLNFRLLEMFTFYMYSKMAIDSKITNPENIAKYVCEHWIKEKPLNEFSVKNRLFFETKFIKMRTLEEILHSIKSIDENIKETLYLKTINKIFINNLIINLTS